MVSTASATADSLILSRLATLRLSMKTVGTHCGWAAGAMAIGRSVPTGGRLRTIGRTASCERSARTTTATCGWERFMDSVVSTVDRARGGNMLRAISQEHCPTPVSGTSSGIRRARCGSVPISVVSTISILNMRSSTVTAPGKAACRALLWARWRRTTTGACGSVPKAVD